MRGMSWRADQEPERLDLRSARETRLCQQGPIGGARLFSRSTSPAREPPDEAGEPQFFCRQLVARAIGAQHQGADRLRSHRPPERRARRASTHWQPQSSATARRTCRPRRMWRWARRIASWFAMNRKGAGGQDDVRAHRPVGLPSDAPYSRAPNDKAGLRAACGSRACQRGLQTKEQARPTAARPPAKAPGRSAPSR